MITETPDQPQGPPAWQPEFDVGVIGLGYVGLTLAVSFARAGLRVVGIDNDPVIRGTVQAGVSPFFEPGLESLLRALPAERLKVTDQLRGKRCRSVVICVGTAVDPKTKQPDLHQLKVVVDDVAEEIAPDTLVVVRSTVPVGTCRALVLRRLHRRFERPLIASCPERTIQGRAVQELSNLPQIVGGLDGRSVTRACELFSAVSPSQVVVSSLETAEMVKLICNAHTDVMYGFGNEVARMADALGLDAHELIESANLRYPRPDLTHPGYVGGSCLTKDPYLLVHSATVAGYSPSIILAARSVNEGLTRHLVDRLLATLTATGRLLEQAKVLVCGVAYKGRPETDDVRGAASVEIARLLGPNVGTLAGHDFVVSTERIADLGFKPMDLQDGLRDADAVLLLVDHPGYAALDLDHLLPGMRRPAIVLDVWGLLKHRLANSNDVRYLRLGRG